MLACPSCLRSQRCSSRCLADGRHLPRDRIAQEVTPYPPLSSSTNRKTRQRSCTHFLTLCCCCNESQQVLRKSRRKNPPKLLRKSQRKTTTMDSFPSSRMDPSQCQNLPPTPIPRKKSKKKTMFISITMIEYIDALKFTFVSSILV